MRGQRLKRADAEPVDVPEGEVIDRRKLRTPAAAKWG